MLEQLAQYGAIGVVLAVVLGLFLWAFKRLFENVLAEHADFKRFMSESIDAMSGIKAAITDLDRTLRARDGGE